MNAQVKMVPNSERGFDFHCIHDIAGKISPASTWSYLQSFHWHSSSKFVQGINRMMFYKKKRHSYSSLTQDERPSGKENRSIWPFFTPNRVIAGFLLSNTITMCLSSLLAYHIGYFYSSLAHVPADLVICMSFEFCTIYDKTNLVLSSSKRDCAKGRF